MSNDPKFGILLRTLKELPAQHPISREIFMLPEYQEMILKWLINNYKCSAIMEIGEWNRQQRRALTPETHERFRQHLREKYSRSYCVCGFCGEISASAFYHEQHLVKTHRIQLNQIAGRQTSKVRFVNQLIEKAETHDSIDHVRF